MPRIKEWLALVNPRVEAFRAGVPDMPTAHDPETKGMKLVFCTPEMMPRPGMDMTVHCCSAAGRIQRSSAGS